MNFFKIKTSWSNTEFALLKICMASAYGLVGAYFHHFFRTYYIPVLIVFGITAVWSLYLWFKKMNSSRQG